MTWSAQQEQAPVDIGLPNQTAQILELPPIWRCIPWWPYEVSNTGQVRNVRTGRILKQDPAKGGYLRVTLAWNGEVCRFMVNRLVCEAFHGPAPTPEHQARHLDGDATSNSSGNLCWGTRSENEQDKRRHGTYQAREKNPFARLTENDVSAIRARYAASLAQRRSLGFQQVEHGLLIRLAEEMNVSVTCIKFVVYRRNWRGQE